MAAQQIWTVAALLALAHCARGGPLPPFHLKCDGNHVGLTAEKTRCLDTHRLFATDNQNPILTWTVAHTERAARQTAFRVIVGEDVDLENVVWDSGKLLKEDETSLSYAGPDLVTGKTYFWRVMWWDHKGEMAVSEETGHFLAAVLDPVDWDKAKWIAAGDGISSAPYLHQTFEIHSSQVERAALFVSGLGFSKPFVNGTDLNAQYKPPIALTPGWTNYEKLVPYTSYEVTRQAQQCTDHLTVGVVLGRGWRNTRDYPLKDPRGIPSSDSTERVLKLLLYVQYKNQSAPVVLVSDESWITDETNITSDSLYDGENYGYLEQCQLVVKTVQGPSGQMYHAEIPDIVEARVEQPVKVYDHLDSRGGFISQIADFGNNSAGYCLVYCDDEPNYSIQFAEVPVHEPYGKMDGSLYYANLRSANATESFDGDVETTHKPSFTYHGFRYAEATGFDRMSLTKNNIHKIVIHSNVAINSKFSCSIPLLNQLQENCIRGQLSNLMSVVTDCDQRDERLGWMGDASLSAETMALNFDMLAFHSNLLQLIASEMLNGTIPDVVPFYRYGNRPADPSWSVAFPEFLYQVATREKDEKSTTEHFYPAVMEYINTTLNTIPEQGISKLPNCRYGDWVPPPPNPKVDNTFTGAFSVLMSVRRMIAVADLLGKNGDVTVMEDVFKKLVDEFNKGFMSSDSQYLNGIQATYVLPLATGAVPADKMDGVVKAFLNRLEQDKYYITGGIVSTRHLFPVLTNLKQHEIAMMIVQQLGYPSYGFMIHNKYEPATTVWELWNSHNGSAGMDSRNHHAFTSVSGWMVTDMAGLSIPKSYKEIHFHPARALGLSHVSVSLEHPKPVHLSWQRNGGIQCAKQAENQSPLNPNLPKHDDLTVSCGDKDGGTINKILFASYGNPTGHCGGYHKRGSCHAQNSTEVVEKLCLGKRRCAVPTGADFWGNPCPDEVKWLSVSVQCKSDDSGIEDFVYSSIRVNVSVPLGSRGLVHLPAHGKRNMKLWDGEKMIFSESSTLNPTLGIMSAEWESDSDALVLELDSGHYELTWKGDNPQVRCLDSRSSSIENQRLILECSNSTDIITTINWASYGTPELKNKDSCFTHTLGECHAGSSKFALEKECVGKTKCVVYVGESFFGKSSCLKNNEQGHLIAEYTCNPRKYRKQ